MNLSRRRFLGFGSALAALAVVAPSALAEVLRSSTTPEAAERLADEHAAWLQRRVYATDAVGPGPFGLWGDGVHDDTYALQLLVDAHAPSGHVLIPPGVFRMSTGLNVPPRNGLILSGGGHSRLMVDGGAAGLTLSGAGRNQMIRDFWIEGPLLGAGVTIATDPLNRIRAALETDLAPARPRIERINLYRA